MCATCERHIRAKCVIASRCVSRFLCMYVRVPVCPCMCAWERAGTGDTLRKQHERRLDPPPPSPLPPPPPNPSPRVRTLSNGRESRTYEHELPPARTKETFLASVARTIMQPSSNCSHSAPSGSCVPHPTPEMCAVRARTGSKGRERLRSAGVCIRLRQAHG